MHARVRSGNPRRLRIEPFRDCCAGRPWWPGWLVGRLGSVQLRPCDAIAMRCDAMQCEGMQRLVGWLAGWLVGWLAGWLVGWLAGWVGGWVVGWLAGWLVGWLVGWLLVGWLVSGKMGKWC